MEFITENIHIIGRILASISIITMMLSVVLVGIIGEDRAFYTAISGFIVGMIAMACLFASGVQNNNKKEEISHALDNYSVYFNQNLIDNDSIDSETIFNNFSYIIDDKNEKIYVYSKN